MQYTLWRARSAAKITWRLIFALPWNWISTKVVWARVVCELADTTAVLEGASWPLTVALLSEYAHRLSGRRDVQRGLKERGLKDLGVEGLEASDWVLVDAGDVILHVFRPEVRAFYNIEKIWSVPLPDSIKTIAPADMGE